MILGMLVIRDEDYFLVIVINCSYITSPITDDDGHDTINPMGSKPILLQSQSRIWMQVDLHCLHIVMFTINRLNILVIDSFLSC